MGKKRGGNLITICVYKKSNNGYKPNPFGFVGGFFAPTETIETQKIKSKTAFYPTEIHDSADSKIFCCCYVA